MEENLKQLLLKDLCARLPYHTKIDTGVQGISTLDSNWYEINRMNLEYDSDAFLPYLRPMSSMTEEEKNEINTLFDIIESPSSATDETGRIIDCSYEYIELIDFYNSRYLDYRGLIEKGLALEAPEDMYK